MAPVTGKVFLDTSVLVGGVLDLGKDTASAQAVMAAVAAGRLGRPATAWHCCLEAYSVLTRLPPELRVSAAVARRIVQEEVLARFEVGDLPAGERQAFLQGLVTEQTLGGRVYDAHIAEVARLMGATTVATDNRRHFVGLLRHGIRVVTAGELAAELG